MRVSLQLFEEIHVVEDLQELQVQPRLKKKNHLLCPYAKVFQEYSLLFLFLKIV